MNMQILTLRPDELSPHPLNSEVFSDLVRDEFEAFKANVAERGIQTPLHVIHGDNGGYVIVTGHQRFRAAELLDISLPCIVREDLVNEWDVKELLICDNLLRRQLTDSQMVKAGMFLEDIERERAKIRQLATLTNVGDSIVKENLPSRGGVGLTRDIVAGKVGFGSGKQYEKAKKVFLHAPDKVKTQWEKGEITTHAAFVRTQDHIELSNVKEDGFVEGEVSDAAPVVELGDVWLLGTHRLMCGDATLNANIELLVDNNRVDMIHVDPPYGVDLNSKNMMLGEVGRGKDWGDIQNDVNKDNLPVFLSKLFKSVGGVINPGAAWYVWYGQANQGIFEGALSELGFLIHRYIIWSKPHMILGRGDYHYKHEACIYGWVKGAGHKWHGSRNQTTVWEVQYDGGRNNAVNTQHPTQKPIELAARAIQNSTIAGGSVLDMCAGAGFTLMAAEQLGRVSYCMEIEPRYCDVIIGRWEKLTGKTAVKLNMEVNENG